jgi:hypothetical protein
LIARRQLNNLWMQKIFRKIIFINTADDFNVSRKKRIKMKMSCLILCNMQLSANQQMVSFFRSSYHLTNYYAWPMAITSLFRSHIDVQFFFVWLNVTDTNMAIKRLAHWVDNRILVVYIRVICRLMCATGICSHLNLLLIAICEWINKWMNEEAIKDLKIPAKSSYFMSHIHVKTNLERTNEKN